MTDPLPTLRTILKSQYRASLAMPREAIELCPPNEWLSTAHKNAFWQTSYHALFFAHLYLQRDEVAFKVWEKQHGDDAVEALDLDRTECGFSWYRMSKLEHQFVNIRHIQHHAAQLIDRVRSAADIGVDWVSAR